MDLESVGRWMREPWLAGGLGALAGLKFSPGETWTGRFINVISGSVCAGYGGPALVAYWKVESHHMQGFLAFAVGMFGLSLAAAVAQAIKQLDLGGLIKGWLERKGL